MRAGSASPCGAGALADAEGPGAQNPRTPLSEDSDAARRIALLLDELAGAGAGRDLFARLSRSGETPREVAQAIAASAAFAHLYKEARTRDVVGQGWKAADPEFLGLTALPPDLPFLELFERHFWPRLGKRAEGFATIFRHLLTRRRELLILETGCLRIPGNWEGDGHSTFMFDALLRDTGGLFFSVDVTMESLETARRACSGRTQLLYGDSVAALYALARCLGDGARRTADLIYLDSYDLDPNNPLPSAMHHVMELTAAGRLIGPGTLVCIDDFGAGTSGGKGMIVDMFFSRIAAPVVYSGYQKMWCVP
jgi:hypothetical protein